MSRFIITRHAHLKGVSLSRPGHWGGVRFADEAAAREAARGHCADAVIEVATVRKRLSVVTP